MKHPIWLPHDTSLWFSELWKRHHFNCNFVGYNGQCFLKIPRMKSKMDSMQPNRFWMAELWVCEWIFSTETTWPVSQSKLFRNNPLMILKKVYLISLWFVIKFGDDLKNVVWMMKKKHPSWLPRARILFLFI